MTTKVLAAITKATGTGRKAFISKAWDAFNAENPGFTVGQFKGTLKGLARAGVVNLTRCDLVDGFDWADLTASALDLFGDGEEVLHFVEVRR